MCRHAAHLGTPIPLAGLLFDPPHSLAHQSWAPSDMRQGGTINADGFGVGWFSAGSTVRYRRATPLWSDVDLPGLAASISSPAILAAVRSATVGMPVTDTAAAPFTDGRCLFSLNGRITGWPHSVAALAKELPPAELLTLDAGTDAAFVWALLRHRLAGGDPAPVIAELVAELATLAPESRLNLLYTDGAGIVATTWWHSLWVRRHEAGVTVASEPLDSAPGWQAVPDRHLIEARTDHVDIRPLPAEGTP